MGQAQSGHKPQNRYPGPFVAITKLPTLISKLEGVHGDFQRVKRAIPNLVATRRFAGNLAAYYAFIGTAGVVLQWIQIKQTYELVNTAQRIAVAQQAMVALEVPIKFAREIYAKVAFEIETAGKLPDGNKNIYFVFNPDNKWYPEFHKLNKRKPLGDQFCGFSDDLPTLCLWMRFIRIWLREQRTYPSRIPHRKEIFHLIIPTYSLVRYEVPLKFSAALYPLVIHGGVIFQEELVQLNLPDAGPKMLDRVKNLYTEPWWFDRWFRPAPVILGEIPEEADRAAREKIARTRSHGRGASMR